MTQAPMQMKERSEAIQRAQRALKADPSRATEAARKHFPAAETALIAELIRRDAPFYDPSISRATTAALNAFGRDMGILSAPTPHEAVVATQFASAWAT